MLCPMPVPAFKRRPLAITLTTASVLSALPGFCASTMLPLVAVRLTMPLPSLAVAPNRRGMQGHGVEWNEQISKDWGGQVMDDYLSAIDDVSKESYVDTARLGCIGASYGGYSAFYLAGIHNNRFKTFIAHDGVFNTQSMFGTTEEVFFNNWDFGGAYWEKDNAVAQKAYTVFNPINLVEKWNTPILIIQGGMDFRVPIGQGQEAFQAAQLRGIKSRFIYFPEENHWVLKPQNAQVWQKEFYKWLKETL